MNDQDKRRHFASLLIAEAEGKQIECNHAPERWEACSLSHQTWHAAELFRIKPEWKLPDPPEGKQWARADYQENDLPQGTRPLLRGERIEQGDECYWILGTYGWEPCDGVIGGFACDYADRKTRTRRPLPGQEIAPGHNPDNLTVAQVGDGYRLIDEDEKRARKDRKALHQIECWRNGEWNRLWTGDDMYLTYRTRLTREALAALDKPKVEYWSRPEHVPGPVCWVRKHGEYPLEMMVVSVWDNGLAICDSYGVIKLVWGKCCDLEHSTDRINWKPCTVKEAR